MTRKRRGRTALPATSGGAKALPPDTQLTITFYLRHRQKVRRRPGSAADLAELTPRVTPAQLEAQRRHLLEPAVEKVAQFAEQTHMKVLEVDYRRRCITLRGKASDAERAFSTKLLRSADAEAQHYPARRPKVPNALAHLVHGFVGLDTRPPSAGRMRAHVDGADGKGLLPSEMAKLYGITTVGRGAGQCIAIVAPAGGYRHDDVAAACQTMNIPMPQIIDITVGGGGNRPGVNRQADEEVALDIQVVAGIAPEARIAVYFTEISERGLVAGISEAVHGTRAQPNVIVVTWGEPEVFWPPEARASLDAVLQDAVRLGITVVATAGDSLATERMNDGRVHVNYPGSSPYVLCCGGTQITLDANGTAIVGEVVWNEGLRGTGGGISEKYAVPAFQANANVPGSRNDGKRGRGLPDVAAAAGKRNGYRVMLGNDDIVASGTSAVAPLWGAFIALVNEQRGQALGFINTRLYAVPDLLKVITSGDNFEEGTDLGYAARDGWSACTGLGSPKGAAIIAAFTAVA